MGRLALRNQYPYELSYGDQRILEIAIALACDLVLQKNLVNRKPYENVRLGIEYVPEDRSHRYQPGRDKGICRGPKENVRKGGI